MKKIFFAVALLIASASATKAQSFDVGSNNITVTTGINTDNGIPIAVSYERGIVSFAADHKLGVGGYLATGGSYTFVAGECNYHYVGFDKFDLYGGARIGFRSLNSDDGLRGTIAVGANYFFASNWAVNAELESGRIPLSAGITFKF